jgi:copper chaperone CopZ
MENIKIVNLKCCGCKTSILQGLERAGLKDLSVDMDTQTVFFSGDREAAKKKLSELGYPEAGSPEAKSLLKKARSFVSCAIGKTKQ